MEHYWTDGELVMSSKEDEEFAIEISEKFNHDLREIKAAVIFMRNGIEPGPESFVRELYDSIFKNDIEEITFKTNRTLITIKSAYPEYRLFKSPLKRLKANLEKALNDESRFNEYCSKEGRLGALKFWAEEFFPNKKEKQWNFFGRFLEYFELNLHKNKPYLSEDYFNNHIFEQGSYESWNEYITEIGKSRFVKAGAKGAKALPRIYLPKSGG